MADTCKVSVIVAAYNAASDLSACLDSMLAQTEADWEVIVVDDHSTDDTAARARAYAARDDRFRVMQTPRNGGPSAARNLGIAQARGEWIGILDSDDRYAPERLARMTSYGEAAGSDVVSDNIVLLTEDDPAGSPMFASPAMAAAHRLELEEFILGNMSKRDEPRVAFGFMKPLFRAAFFRGKGLRYDETMRFSEDFVLYIACLQQGARWDYVPEAMYLYTVREGSLSGGTLVQSPSELRRIYDFSRDLAASPAARATPGTRRAAQAYFRRVRRWYSYRAVVEHLKTRRFGDAVSLLARSPDAIGGVAAEALVQAPALARKVARKVPGLSALAG